jgi:hypothetical protein
MRAPAYPYFIYGDDCHELWIVDYFRTIPFVQGLASELQFSGSDASDRTSVFDARLAELLGQTPGVELAFQENREVADLPNVKFYFNGGAEHREIDIPLRFGKVLIAVQTWAREVDLRIAAGDYRAMKRRRNLAKSKLKSTDQHYTDYLLGHREGRQHMVERGFQYVLPVLCGLYTEPVASLKPKYWLRHPSMFSLDEVEKAIPRILTPDELVNFLTTATEQELSAICERNGWKL